MFRKLIASVTLVAATIAVPMVFPVAAHASIDFSCRSDLIKDRFDAVDGVISASHFFTRDVTAFIDVGADSPLELQNDYRESRRDLAVDLREGLRDVALARREAIQDMRSDCGGFTSTRVSRELAFYSRMDARLLHAYHKARLALRNAYIAALQSCC